jgi:hypothetical protein
VQPFWQTVTNHPKVTHAAQEHNKEHCIAFQVLVGENYPSSTLVFLDEAACNQHTSKWTLAWGCKGD